MLNPHTSGGDRWNDEAYGRLGACGIEVAWTSEALPLTHEKSLVVDSTCVLVATFNLSDKYFTETRDYGVVSYAVPVVEQVIAGFEADWNRSFFHPDLTVGLVWSSVRSRGQMARIVDMALESGVSAGLRADVAHPHFAALVYGSGRCAGWSGCN